MKKPRKPSKPGKLTKKQQRMIREYDSYHESSQPRSDALPDFRSQVPAPPVQWPDCMPAWMDAWGHACNMDGRCSQIQTLQQQNGIELPQFADAMVRVSSCIASHQV